MSIPQLKGRLQVVDYLKMAEQGLFEDKLRVELLNGKLTEMSPAGKRHAAMVKRLTALFSQILDKKYILSVQDPIVIGEDSMPEPDLAILAYRADFYENDYPQAADVLLVIEVADSTLARDRRTKGRLYAQAGIPEYWLINLSKNQVEAFSEPSEEGYGKVDVKSPQDTLNCAILGVSIALKLIFH